MAGFVWLFVFVLPLNAQQVDEAKLKHLKVNPTSGGFWQEVRLAWASSSEQTKQQYTERYNDMAKLRSSSNAKLRLLRSAVLSNVSQHQDNPDLNKLLAVADRPSPVCNACLPGTAAAGQLEVFGIGADNKEVEVSERLLPASFLKHMVQTLHGASSIAASFQAGVQAIAADQGQLPKKVAYRTVCQGICRKSNLFAFVQRLRKGLASIVSDAGGADACSDATQLFAIERWQDGAALSVHVVLLVVATATPALQVFLKCEFSPPVTSLDAWDPAAYAGLEVSFQRLEHTPNDSAPAMFQSTSGMLDFAMSADLSVSVATAEVDKVAIRKLGYTSSSLTRMSLTGVVGEPVWVQATAAKVRARAKASSGAAAAKPGLDWLSLLEPVDIASFEGDIQSHSDHGDCDVGCGNGAEEPEPEVMDDDSHDDDADGDGVVDDAADSLDDVFDRSFWNVSGVRLGDAHESLLEEEAAAEEEGSALDAQPSATSSSSSAAPVVRSALQDQASTDIQDLINVIESERSVKMEFVSANGAYNVKRLQGDQLIGTVFTLGTGSMKTQCRVHKRCSLFINPRGDWLQAFHDSVEWVTMSDEADIHKGSAEIYRAGYAAKSRSASAK